MGERKIGLIATIAVAVVLLVGVSIALLAFDPRTTGADALRTGGLAAGSVVALYALWLNDRRRRVEEERQKTELQRHELENRRADLDRDRVADERFARAVELLGHEADQVRVGALHALAGLARSNPDYTQTVLDVLCSYLRRPFWHHRHTDDAPASAGTPLNTDDDGPVQWSRDAKDGAERKLQVRLTAQRLIADLLPAAGDEAAPAYDLDLTNASLEYFDLSDRKVGSLILRYGKLFSDNNFSRCEYHGEVWFTGTAVGAGRLYGRFRCDDAVFHQRAWFPGVEFNGRASFRRTRFHGQTRFADSRFADAVLMTRAEFHGPADFRAVHFEHDADLSGTTFHAETQHTGITTSPDREVVLPDGWKAVSA
ncbi:pentapeptide repeat-containing protein [Saccharopolyspora pogona]|uniref:pentapeptide repeat-containing protein n=1 Tax=Saccharopolyspora pogona TaxID=333966 RepID=UPI001686BCEA|nr:pentapeptide repeat-containing protein [Saccharopolyspora pogona]